MGEVLFVKNHGYGHKILQSLYQLQKRGVNCDITLKAHDGFTHVHRLILLASSYVDIENDQNAVRSKFENPQIDCTKYTIITVNAVVQFMYTGEIIVEQRHSGELNSLCEELSLDFACTTLKQHDFKDKISQEIISQTVPHVPQVLSLNNEKQNLPDDIILSPNHHSGFSVQSNDRDGNFSEPCLELDKEETLFDQPECLNNFVPNQYIGNDSVPAEGGNQNYMYRIRKDDENDINICFKREMLDESSNEDMSETLQMASSPNNSTDLSNLEKFNINIPKNVKQLNAKFKRNGTIQKIKVSDKEYNTTERKEKTLHEKFKQLSSNSNCRRKQSCVNSTDMKNKTENHRPKRRKKKTHLTVRRKKSSINMAKKNELSNIAKSCGGKITDRVVDQNVRSETAGQEIIDETVSKKSNELSQDPQNGNMNKRNTRKCAKCNVEFNTYGEQTKHLRDVHRPFPCDLCDWVGPYSYLYASHMYGRHKIVIFPDRYPLIECEEEDCSFKCLSMNMYDHKRIHRYKIEKLMCDVCGSEFTSSGGLRIHAESHKETNNEFPCKQCGKVFGRKCQLQTHENNEHAPKKLCHQCPYTARNQGALTIHLHHKHGEPIPNNKKLYKCDSCDFYCLYPSYLKHHREECHSDTPMYKCSVCAKSFKSRKSLRRHQNIHNTQKYKCSWCEYTTSSSSTLKMHQASTHSEAKPFSCHLCEVRCKLKGNLRKHLKNIHKTEIMTSAKLHDRMIKTGKGYKEYLNARRDELSIESNTNSLSLLQGTQPIVDNYNIPGPDSKTVIDGQMYSHTCRSDHIYTAKTCLSLLQGTKPIVDNNNIPVPESITMIEHGQMYSHTCLSDHIYTAKNCSLQGTQPIVDNNNIPVPESKTVINCDRR